jgi:late competence protein required for DNA uptake (superfamily II DNA/RNA helicase)
MRKKCQCCGKYLLSTNTFGGQKFCLSCSLRSRDFYEQTGRFKRKISRLESEVFKWRGKYEELQKKREQKENQLRSNDEQTSEKPVELA